MLVTVPELFAQADLSLDFTGQNNGTGCPASCGAQTPIAPKGQALYDLTVHNTGPGTSSNVAVVMNFASNTTIDHFTPTPGMTCTSSVVAGAPTLTCSIASVSVGALPSVVVTLNLNSNYSSPTIVATATVSSATGDPVPGNNSATVTLPVTLPIPTLNPIAMSLLGIALTVIGFFAIRRY